MKDSIILNFLDYVTIKITGCEKTIDNIKNYFPNLIVDESDKIDYYIEEEGVLKQFPKVPSNYKKIKPFKASEYIVYKINNVNFAFSENSDEFCNKHLITKENNKISIFSSDDNYEMIATRICREIIFQTLIARGFIPIHASAVSIDNKGYIFIGKGGSGKSTTMLYNVLYNEASPIANDVVMIGKKKNDTVVIGMPFKVTISTEMLNLFGYKCQNQSNKKRFALQEFEKEFKQKWVWESTLNQVFLLKYNSTINNYKLCHLNTNDFQNFVEQVLKEENFCFGDYLEILKEVPNSDYKMLEDNHLYIEGNIVEYFKRGM